MKEKTLSIVSIGLFSLGLATTSANAALVSKLGGQVIYDTDLNLSWLTNANLAASNTFGVSGIAADGSMDWNTANTWIAAMNLDGPNGYLGVSDWRLPVTIQPDPSCSDQSSTGAGFGSGCTASEMGHLNNIEGIFWNSSSTSGTPFSNLQFNEYWSSTEFVSDTTGAWAYGFDLTGQTVINKNSIGGFAWAVRSGDISEVPLPATAWLFASGLIGFIGISKRKR